MRQLDTKYHVDGDRIIKTATGEPVPEDEPLFLFRGRDKLAIVVLRVYHYLCECDHCTNYQIQSLDEMIDRFAEFAERNPDRMKQPGVTMGL